MPQINKLYNAFEFFGTNGDLFDGVVIKYNNRTVGPVPPSGDLPFDEYRPPNNINIDNCLYIALTVINYVNKDGTFESTNGFRFLFDGEGKKENIEIEAIPGLTTISALLTNMHGAGGKNIVSSIKAISADVVRINGSVPVSTETMAVNTARVITVDYIANENITRAKLFTKSTSSGVMVIDFVGDVVSEF